MNHHRPFELVVPVGAADHLLGSEHAAVTVVEYGDFECPNCGQAAPAVKMLLERFAGRARVAFRHFPLEGAAGPGAGHRGGAAPVKFHRQPKLDPFLMGRSTCPAAERRGAGVTGGERGVVRRVPDRRNAPGAEAASQARSAGRNVVVRRPVRCFDDVRKKPVS